MAALEDLAAVVHDLVDVATGRIARLGEEEAAAHRATLAAIATPETSSDAESPSGSELVSDSGPPEPGPGDAAAPVDGA